MSLFHAGLTPALDANGDTLSGATWSFYLAGTNTPVSVYAEPTLETAMGSSVAANAAGRFPAVFLDDDQEIRAVLRDAFGATITRADIASIGNTLDAGSFKFSHAGSYPDGTIGKAFDDRPVNPMDAPYNAKGDGTTDDRTALLSALQSGRIVDGGGKTFALSGELNPASLKGLRNCKLKWLDPAAHPTGALLNIVGISDFELTDVVIDIGVTSNTGANGDSDRNGVRIWSSTPGSTTVSGFRLTRVSVTGDGHGTRIQIRGGTRFHVDNCWAYDGTASYTPDPTDDIMNGFDFKFCTQFTVSNCRAWNLRSISAGVPSTRRTRGFLFAECQDFLDLGNSASFVDQGCDYSGGAEPIGNRGFTKIGGTYSDCSTFGVKFANVTRDGICEGVSVIRPGFIGIVASSSSVVLGNPALNTSNIDVIGCKVIDPTGFNGLWANPQGFRVMSNVNYPDWPRAIRFINCKASDTQSVPKMVDGFASDVIYDGTSLDLNEAIGCKSKGHTSSAESGMASWKCSLYGEGTLGVDSGTPKAIEFTRERFDSAGMHSTTSIPSNVYITLPGRYRLTYFVTYAANATGTRTVRVLKNGVAADGTASTVNAVGGSQVTTLYASSEITCIAGDNLRLEGLQDSGGTVAIDMANSWMTVELVEAS